MKKLTLIFMICLFCIYNSALATSKAKNTISDIKISEAKSIIESLLPFRKSSLRGQFSIQGCKKDESKWMLLLIAKQPFTEKVTFNKSCHIQGTYTAKMNIPFPMNFKLKKVKNYNQVKFNFLIKLIYEPIPMIKIEMQNGTLSNKENKKNKSIIKFKVDYAAEIDPLSKDFIKKDLGGFIHINSINGRKTKLKYPIKR